MSSPPPASLRAAGARAAGAAAGLPRSAPDTGPMRVPLLLVATALAAVVVLIELGSLALPPQAQQPAAAVAALCASSGAPADCATPAGRAGLLQQVERARLTQPPTPGLGIPAMAIADGLLLFILALMAVALVVPARIQGRVQGVVGLFLSLSLIFAGIAVAVRALGQLVLMVSLLLAFPFGTIVYLIIWGFFDRGGAAVALSLLLLCKVVIAVCLALAHQRFLTDKGLIVLVAGALLVNLVVAFLHGLVPLFLVSITDAIAAIVVAIVGIVLWLLSLGGSAVSIVRAISPQA